MVQKHPQELGITRKKGLEFGWRAPQRGRGQDLPNARPAPWHIERPQMKGIGQEELIRSSFYDDEVL